MKFFKIFIICFLFLGLQKIHAQNNNLDIKLKTINNFHNLLDGKYSTLRKKIDLDKNIVIDLKNLKQIYTSKLWKHIHDFDYVDLNQTKIYESFHEYPSLNFVLLNKTGAFENHEISDEEKQKYSEMILEIAKQIPNETYMEISAITDEINKDKIRLIIPYKLEIFQDFLDENARKRIEIINFLLWNLE